MTLTSFPDIRDQVLSYIQSNGVMVSNRWRIGEEVGSNGELVIRDVFSSIVLGVDARYAFSVDKLVDLWETFWRQFFFYVWKQFIILSL